MNSLQTLTTLTRVSRVGFDEEVVCHAVPDIRSIIVAIRELPVPFTSGRRRRAASVSVRWRRSAAALFGY